MWSFECVGPDGQTYLHLDNWNKFILDRNLEYPHNWNHHRAILTLCTPRANFDEIPGVTQDTFMTYIEKNYSTIFIPYPAHVRTGVDPNSEEESWNVFVEDNHINPLGEKVLLYSTTNYFFGSYNFAEKPQRFAAFRGKYWLVLSVRGGGLGVAEPPPDPVVKKPQKIYRSLDDDFVNFP